MNLYRGCEHHCIYCDSRSACYRIADFDGELLVKVNALDLLRKELTRKRQTAAIGTGAMQDPYTPSEAKLNMTGQALRVIAEFGFSIHIITKSDLILKDLDTLVEINESPAGSRASACFTLTTTDDALARKIEPGAPPPSRRLVAARALADRGIPVGIMMMPVLPFIEDNAENITAIVTRAAEAGAQCVMPWFGMSLRQGQREYFYRQLDRLFPGLRIRYERQYGDRYDCPCNHAQRLAQHFEALCAQHGLLTTASNWPARRESTRRESTRGEPAVAGQQLSLF
jgi:DNA repair photolyase